MEIYIPDRSLPRAFICDIDGTVADHEGIRGHFDYTLVSQDRPIYHIIHVVQALVSTGDWTPVFVSGREEYSRRDTLDWIDTYIWPGMDYRLVNLFMRPDGDYRKDYLIKNEIFFRDIAPNFWVEFAIDDRKQVVDMWREIGLPCLHVAEGNF